MNNSQQGKWLQLTLFRDPDQNAREELRLEAGRPPFGLRRRGRGSAPAVVLDVGGEAAELDGPVLVAPDAQELPRRCVALAGIPVVVVEPRRGLQALSGNFSRRESFGAEALAKPDWA